MDKNSQDTGGVISLESILAEYKGNAYIKGEKKTSKEQLDKETEQIFKDNADAYAEESDDGSSESRTISFSNREEDMTDLEKEFFGVGQYARAPLDDNLPQATVKASENTAEVSETDIRPETAERPKRARKRIITERVGQNQAETQKRRKEKEPAEEPPAEPELEPAEASRIYSATLNSLFIRGVAASILGIVMLYLTLAHQIGLPMPKLFEQNSAMFSAVMLLMLFIIMLMGLDILIVGIKDALRLKPGAETLIVLSCIVSVIDAISIVINGKLSYGMPFCGVSALSMVFAIWGMRYMRSAMRTTLSTASVSSAPYVVTTKSDLIDNGAVAVKNIGGTAGFTNQTEQPDFNESMYSFAAPMFIVSSLVLALLSSVVRGRAGAFLHCWSAMAAVTAQFSIMFVFGFPFHIISKKLMRSGAAIAGWAGASEISRAFGVVVKDNDVFPTGTISMNGIRMFNGASMQKTVSYTGSLIIASGSGLSGIFRDLMRQQGSKALRVEGLSCYEAGGIGATIGPDHILVGSSGFMNLMGIRLPQELNVKNAVFSAINNELSGIFAINYTPVSSVQNALVSILRTKISTIFAVRDFNISPLMLTQKFKISVDKVEFMTVEERYKLSGGYTVSDEPLALLCREGLGPFAEVVAGGKRFVRVVCGCSALSVFGALIGLLLMFYLCWSGAFDAASAANTMIYMLMWLVPVLLLGNSSGMY